MLEQKLSSSLMSVPFVDMSGDPLVIIMLSLISFGCVNTLAQVVQCVFAALYGSELVIIIFPF